MFLLAADFVHGGKNHARLKTDPRAGGRNVNWTTPAHGLDPFAIERASVSRFAAQALAHAVFTARVGLVAVGKGASAFWTMPQARGHNSPANAQVHWDGVIDQAGTALVHSAVNVYRQ